ncbi:MAG TPA: cellulase family glycosylhydrolase [Solirubrobacteraceae bacterium]|nr:cellulase family glycosylhydrolase [Solirubrobacteraceae bacterium]
MLSLASAPAQGAESGVVVNSPTGLSQQSDGLLAGLGVGWVRSFVPWNAFEPTSGQINQSQVNALESGLAALPKGTKVILDVVSTPQWESGSTNPAMPPHNPADYARFVGAMARRFAGRVAAWEIWNEEDASLWWASGPDPSAYAALLKETYRAIKAADPNVTVVLGGLTGNDYEYLSQLYAVGAKGSFDAVGLHTDTICNVVSPYEILRNGRYDRRINRWAFLGYRTVREIMQANGDGSPIWMTELGWSSSSQICNSGAWAGQKAGGVSPQQQAAFLQQAYHCLAQDSYVQVGIWYGLQETEPFGSPRGSYGLLDPSLAPKPAYAALADYSHNGDRLTEPCGGQQGPAVKLVRPKTGVRYTNTLPIAVSASDRFRVYEITLYHDGQIIRNFSVHGGATTLNGHMVWYGARLLSPGKHVLTAQAIDLRNNTTTTSITIVRSATPNKHAHKHHRGRKHGAHHKHS